MSPEMADIAIGEFLKGLRERLEQAAGVAKAAEACAEAGNPEKGVEIVLDVEPLIYETTTLLNGPTLINRCAKSKPRGSHFGPHARLCLRPRRAPGSDSKPPSQTREGSDAKAYRHPTDAAFQSDPAGPSGQARRTQRRQAGGGRGSCRRPARNSPK